MNGFNFNSFGNSKQTISYCEVDKCKAVIKLKQALKNIAEGKIGKCCCPEEYAMEVLSEK